MTLSPTCSYLLSPLRCASVLKKNKKKREQTIQYCRRRERQRDFLRLSFLLGFVAVLLTAQTTYAVTCQPDHHDNKGHHGNKESYDVKKVVLIPRDVKHLSSEMTSSTVSEYILYPITSLLKRRAFTVFYQTRNMYRFGFESKKQNKTKQKQQLIIPHQFWPKNIRHFRKEKKTGPSKLLHRILVIGQGENWPIVEQRVSSNDLGARFLERWLSLTQD